MRKSLFTILLLPALAAALQTQGVLAYPAAAYSQPSADFPGISVGGQTVYVEKFQDFQYSHFAFTSPVECIITAKEKIETWVIQPLRRGITGKVEGNTLRFTISHLDAKPGYFVVQVNKLGRLVLLGDRPETDVPDPRSAGVRVVTAAPYLADPTGAANSTAAIQKAIDDAAAAGGGTVYVPAGTFQVIATLYAKSKVSLYLAPGARIRSNPDRKHYGNDGFIDGMVKTNGVDGFRLFGRGTMDASGMDIMIFEKDNLSTRRRLFTGAGISRNTRIEGVVLRDATQWTVVIRNTDSCLVRNVKIINHWNQATVKIENDGINMVGSRWGLAEGNFVITGDDAMCAKANGRETAYLTFKDNTVLTFAAGNKAGMQSSAPMHDILFTGTDILACRRGLVVETLQGAVPTTGIRFENIVIDGYHSLPGWRQKVVELLAEESKISNVEIGNVTSYGGAEERGGILDGMGNGISKVAFKGLRYGTTQILSAQAGRLTLKNTEGVTFEAGPGPSLALGRPRPSGFRPSGFRFHQGVMRIQVHGRSLPPMRVDGRPAIR